jgi:enamine deaminase RidA (YjgF/YER057c/UK114 family)
MEHPPVQHINPDGMHANPAFSNLVVVETGARTVYVGGQNAVTVDGEVVGPGDLAAQTRRAFDNLEMALAAAGSGLERVVKWNIYVVDGQPLEEGFSVFQERWPSGHPPPAIPVAVVASLAHPDFLVEIDAIAVA